MAFQLASRAHQFLESRARQRNAVESGPMDVFDGIILRKTVHGLPPYIPLIPPPLMSIPEQREWRYRYRTQVTNVTNYAAPGTTSYVSTDGFAVGDFGRPTLIGLPGGLRITPLPLEYYGTGYTWNKLPEEGTNPPGIPRLTYIHKEGVPYGGSPGTCRRDLGSPIDHIEDLKQATNLALATPFPIRTAAEIDDIDPITGFPQGWQYFKHLKLHEFRGNPDGNLVNVDVRTIGTLTGEVQTYVGNFPLIDVAEFGFRVSYWFQSNLPMQEVIVCRARPRLKTPTPYFLVRGPIVVGPEGIFTIGHGVVIATGVSSFWTPLEIPLPHDVDVTETLELPVETSQPVGQELGYGLCTAMVLNETPAEWSARTGHTYEWLG